MIFLLHLADPLADPINVFGPLHLRDDNAIRFTGQYRRQIVNLEAGVNRIDTHQSLGTAKIDGL